MAFLKCKMCGGDLVIEPDVTVCECEYCGSKQTLPKLDDDKKANLYDRANHFRRNNDFDKAMGIYEQILSEDNTDAESYWSIVLCRYGIEYVEDGASHKRIPTVNRAQLTSIYADEDYKSAIKYADAFQRKIYEEEAKTIDEIQKRILEISDKEDPFDVFICYKETDGSGRRTRDSVLANDLYNQLTQEGYKVFFSRITLEDKLGTAYEPYIFAALNSAKVMVVVGTKPEFFNAAWVKNEWSRYLALIKGGAKKTLIPAYRDMDPYDLPEEFSHLQAQDMGKLGFMHDLIRGIKKIIAADAPKAEVKETVVVNHGSNSGIEPLLRRAFMFLEDGNWASADEYCEKVLDQEPENARAYLGKLMAELQVRKQEKLADCKEPFDNKDNYKKALRFADEKLASELKGYITHINERNEAARIDGIYKDAVETMNRGKTLSAYKAESAYKSAAVKFKHISGYKDSDALAAECLEKAEQEHNRGIEMDRQKAEEERIQAERERKKAEEERMAGIYKDAVQAMQSAETESDYKSAAERFQSIPDYKDAKALAAECLEKAEAAKKEAEAKAEAERIAKEKEMRRNKQIVVVTTATAAVMLVFVIVLNTVILPAIDYNKAVGYMENGQYTEAIALFTELDGYKNSEDMIAETKYLTAVEYMENGQYNKAAALFSELGDYKGSEGMISEIEDAISETKYLTAVKYMESGQYTKSIALFKEINEYKDSAEKITSIETKLKETVLRPVISAYGGHTIGLKADGTVMAVGYSHNHYGQCDVDSWSDIVAVSTKTTHTLGLKTNGTVVAVGRNEDGECNVSSWTDIVAVSAGNHHTVGLKANGTVVAVGSDKDGECNVASWRDIVAVSAGYHHTVGLKADGTVVAVGRNKDGQCNVSSWKDIVAVSAGTYRTLGVKADGTVVAVGDNRYGECNVASWRDIVAVSAGYQHTVGLKADGTVVAVGVGSISGIGRCNVTSWTDIVAISAGDTNTVGLKADGTVVAVGNNKYGECKVDSWQLLK